MLKTCFHNDNLLFVSGSIDGVELLSFPKCSSLGLDIAHGTFRRKNCYTITCHLNVCGLGYPQITFNLTQTKGKWE